eukprot:3582949-Amphidinium_carterae.1
MSYARTDDANNFQRHMEQRGREMSELLRSYGAHRLAAKTFIARNTPVVEIARLALFDSSQLWPTNSLR